MSRAGYSLGSHIATPLDPKCFPTLKVFTSAACCSSSSDSREGNGGEGIVGEGPKEIVHFHSSVGCNGVES